MILQYFKKKENEYKEKADEIYSLSIDKSKNIINKNFLKKANFDSSFEITSIILIFCLKILKDHNKNKNNEISNYLINNLILDLDNTFREMGIGDMSIGKHVKKYVKKFYYRIRIIDPIIERTDFHKLYEYLKSLKSVDKSDHKNIVNDLLEVYKGLKKNILNY